MERNKRLRIVFISSGLYPESGAATNRHLAYSKGLVQLGHEVQFLLLSRQSWKEETVEFDGIKFTCLNRSSNDTSSKIKKAIIHLQTIRNVKKTIKELNTKDPISALIILNTSISILWPLINYGRKLDLKIIHERTEYPSEVRKKGILGQLDLQIYLKYLVKKFDGLYVINNALKKYFSKIANLKIRIVNMVVDPARFNVEKDNCTSGKIFITYCGTLNERKDGVCTLIKSFALISNEFFSVTLQLIAPLTDEKTKQEIDKLISDLGIQNRVVFTGQKTRNEIPMLLKKSDLLVLARPKNKQAEGGFPTKLGEYLASGVPVVVTDVGEIKSFLKDNVNAFIAEPDSIDEFSKKLREALLCKDRAKIGLEGKKLVYNEFNYLTQAKEIVKLIEEVSLI